MHCCAQVPFSNGSAVFNLVSQKLDALIITKLVTKLQGLKNKDANEIHSKLGADDKLAGLLNKNGE